MQAHDRRNIGALLLLAAMALGGCEAASSAPAMTNRRPVSAAHAEHASFIHARAIIIVRHGDIDISSKKTLGGDAPLTARGRQRARALAYALKDAGITRIITSETLRTQQTAAVLAKELQLTPESPFGHGGAKGVRLPDSEYAAAKKQEAVTVLHYLQDTATPDDVILLVHHHSVIPGLLKGLGYQSEPPFVEDAEFDRVYVVLPDEQTHTYHIMRLRYGGEWGGNGN